MAKLTKAKPTLEVVPPSGDSEDREAALLGESILEHLWRYLKCPQKIRRALGWLLATGNVYLSADWDPEAGESQPRTVLVEVADPNNPGQTTDVECGADENGEPYRRKPTSPEDVALDGGEPYDLEREPEVEPIGEIVFDVDDPMSVRLNPEATSHDDAEEMFVGKLWPRQKAADFFGVAPEDLTSSGGESTDDREGIEQLLSSVAAGPPDPFMTGGQSIGSSQRDGIGQSDRVLVLYYYRKQCAKEGYPEGRHWITVGSKKVWPPENDAEFPNAESPLPFGFWPPRIPIIDTPIPSQPQGLGLLGQVVPLNEQLDYLDGKIGEYHTTMAMGGVIWVHPRDKGVQITSEPGQVKVSQGMVEGHPPIREQLTALPDAVYHEREVLTTKLQMVAGMSQVDMSQRPEGVTAGRAFLVLQEASDAPLMPTLAAIEEGLCELGRRFLVIAQQKYSEPRSIKIRGNKGQYEFRSFVGSDLRDGMDVRIQAGSMYPWSKSAQFDTKLSVIQALPQLVLKPDGTVDKEQLARLLDSGVPGIQAFESDEDPDLVEIDREHAMFEAYDPTNPNGSNQLPQLGFWQNQPKHQEYHFNFMKRDRARFERWHPAAQLAFMEHMRLTTEAVDQLAASMVGATSQAPAGAAGENAPPGGPAAPADAGGRKMQLVPPGGEAGRANTPGANRKQSQLQLTRADRAAAGQ